MWKRWLGIFTKGLMAQTSATIISLSSFNVSFFIHVRWQSLVQVISFNLITSTVLYYQNYTIASFLVINPIANVIIIVNRGSIIAVVVSIIIIIVKVIIIMIIIVIYNRGSSIAVVVIIISNIITINIIIVTIIFFNVIIVIGIASIIVIIINIDSCNNNTLTTEKQF